MARPNDSDLENEWEEKRKITNLLWKIVKTTMSGLTWKTRISSPNPSVTTTADQALEASKKLPVIKSDHVFKTSDGELLLVFLKGGLYRPWRQEVHEELDKRIQTSLHDLLKDYPVPQPKQTDVRHSKHNEKSTGYTDYGLYHLCCWKAQGHSQEPPVLSEDIIADGHTLNSVWNFCKTMTPITPIISLLFGAIDRDSWTQYHTNYNCILQDTALKAIHTSGRACFLGLSVVVNMALGPHKDSNDVKDGWVAMICTGNFTGGNLVLPALEAQLEHTPGDVVFFRSTVLEHYLAAFEGERVAMVSLSMDDTFQQRLQQKIELPKR